MIRICGLDEVGRGAFAGPLVAAAVVIKCPIDELLANCPVPIRDSKTLNHLQRQTVAEYLKGKSVRTYIEVIPVTEINERGMGWANREIFIRLINRAKASRFVVDGNLKFNLPGIQVRSQIKADSTIPQVILAGIVAKLHRDTLMRSLHRSYPLYHWWVNKGYGTLKHRQAITEHGVSEHHRTLWVETWKFHQQTSAEERT